MVVRHPSAISRPLNSGTRTNWPRQLPAIARLIAVPRRFSNHRAIMAPKRALVSPPSPAAAMTP